MAQALNLRCSGDHAHETVEGKATGLSAMYSPQLARRIANVVVPTKIPGGGQNSKLPTRGSLLQRTETAAEDYLELILANEWQEGGLEKALLQGNHLLEATGGVSEAALVLRTVGRVRLGDHFAELGDQRLDDAIDADLLAYARTVADKGVRACYEGDRSARVTAEPHASAREHLPEAMSQLWKDARRGRVILCDDRAGRPPLGGPECAARPGPENEPRPDGLGGRSDGLGPARPQRRDRPVGAPPRASAPSPGSHPHDLVVDSAAPRSADPLGQERMSRRHSSGSGSMRKTSPSSGRTSRVRDSGSPNGASQPSTYASLLASRVPLANGWCGPG